MTTSDGSVLGSTQIHGTAPRNRAFTIVLLADGFTSTQQTDFDNACTDFVTALTTTAPYDTIGRPINIWRINVTSTDSGADDPASAGGTGATAATYFDSTFGGNGIRRLLLCDTTTVLQTAAAQVPEFTAAIVVVNSTIYGGGGGSVGAYSLAGGATEIALHELGHTAYKLADEYPCYACDGVETGHDVHPLGEPTEPNVTQNTARDTLKWGWAVAPTTDLPTTSNPNCPTVDPQSSPVPTGTVGCFEGAHYYHCDAFRPEYDCKMKSLSTPFCQVCRQVIRTKAKVTKNLCALTPSRDAVYLYDGSGDSWTRIGGPAGQLFTGAWGLVATNPDTGDLYRYLGSPDNWQYIGGPGAEFAVSADTVYGLTPSSDAVYSYDGFDNSWTRIGGPAGRIFAGVWGLVATNPDTGDLYRYLGSPDNWDYIGGPGAEFAVAPDTVYGLTPSSDAVYRYDGFGNSWTRVGGPAGHLFTGDWGRGLVATNPDNGDLYTYMGTPDSWRYTGGAGASFAVATDTVYGLSPGSDAVYSFDGFGSSWTRVGGPAYSIAAGNI
ncbi:M64 family metallopeptidase [Streptomyces laurentii]|uniref:M64 family metallopeptidase n=1 Tax=Streptomyces laurentii TaxID=39478 RepID=UPI0036C1EB66